MLSKTYIISSFNNLHTTYDKWVRGGHAAFIKLIELETPTDDYEFY